jgi:hypothetical protein
MNKISQLERVGAQIPTNPANSSRLNSNQGLSNSVNVGHVGNDNGKMYGITEALEVNAVPQD